MLGARGPLSGPRSEPERETEQKNVSGKYLDMLPQTGVNCTGLIDHGNVIRDINFRCNSSPSLPLLTLKAFLSLYRSLSRSLSLPLALALTLSLSLSLSPACVMVTLVSKGREIHVALSCPPKLPFVLNALQHNIINYLACIPIIYHLLLTA